MRSALEDVGIHDESMKTLGARLTPGTSALFILARKITADKVLDKIAPHGGEVLSTSLSKEDEAKLRSALEEAQAGQSKV